MAVRQNQWIAAGDQNLHDAGIALQPADRFFDFVRAGERMRHQRIFDFPVALAIHADLAAGVVGLKDGDMGIAPGDQIDRGGVPLVHKVQAVLLIGFTVAHLFNIMRRWDDLAADCMIQPLMRCTIHQGDVIGRDGKGQSVTFGLIDGVPLGSVQADKTRQRPAVPDQMTQMPSIILPVRFLRLPGGEQPAAVGFAPGDDLRL
ncbi:MAG: hypothetical protein BWY83_00894 [bacterium ADurb.Bin478]|nr:MAG: hypothetical protein BWY83_00894 [bacterium ADurb.Bin478]